jgi:hypothetical protein
MRRLLSSLALLTAAVAASASAQTVPDPELDQIRGGYLVAGELAFEFGAVVRTYENGALALQSTVTWTDAGPVVNQLSGPGAAVTPVTSSDLAALAGSGAVTTAGGATVMHRLTEGQISSILMNTASGQDLRQHTDVTLVLPGFAATQADMIRNLSGVRIADDVAVGAIRATGH